jgi:hypothetical protein
MLGQSILTFDCISFEIGSKMKKSLSNICQPSKCWQTSSQKGYQSPGSKSWLTDLEYIRLEGVCWVHMHQSGFQSEHIPEPILFRILSQTTHTIILRFSEFFFPTFLCVRSLYSLCFCMSRMSRVYYVIPRVDAQTLHGAGTCIYACLKAGTPPQCFL